jgi:hypothetical protein
MNGWNDMPFQTVAQVPQNRYEFNELCAGRKIWFRVLARNSAGTSPGDVKNQKDVSSLTLASSIPFAPAFDDTTPPIISFDSFTFSVIAPECDGGSTILSYDIQTSLNGVNFDGPSVSRDATLLDSLVSPPVSADTTIFYRVRANNINNVQNDKYWTAVRNITTQTLEPGAPTSITAVANGTDAMLVSWVPPSWIGAGNALTFAGIEYQVTGAGTWGFQQLVSPGTATSALIVGLSPSTTYDFRVSCSSAGSTLSDFGVSFVCFNCITS